MLNNLILSVNILRKSLPLLVFLTSINPALNSALSGLSLIKTSDTKGRLMISTTEIPWQSGETLNYQEERRIRSADFDLE